MEENREMMSDERSEEEIDDDGESTRSFGATKILRNNLVSFANLAYVIWN